MVVERVGLNEAGECELGPNPATRPLSAAASELLLAPPDGFEPPTPALGRLRSIH